MAGSHLETWGMPGQQRRLWDLTVCAPHAQRYLSNTHAVVAAEARTNREYPSRTDAPVSGIAINQYGCFGVALREALEHWAMQAQAEDESKGRNPRRWMSMWCAQFSMEVAVGTARMVLTANRSQAVPPADVQVPTTPLVQLVQRSGTTDA